MVEAHHLLQSKYPADSERALNTERLHESVEAEGRLSRLWPQTIRGLLLPEPGQGDTAET